MEENTPLQNAPEEALATNQVSTENTAAETAPVEATAAETPAEAPAAAEATAEAPAAEEATEAPAAAEAAEAPAAEEATEEPNAELQAEAATAEAKAHADIEAEAEKSVTDAEEPAAEETPDYSQMDRQQLVNAMNELLAEEVQRVHGRAAAIRNRFTDLNRDVQRQAYEAFLAAGGIKEEYQEKNDAVADTFYHLYDQYRASRQRYLDAIEEQKRSNLEAKQNLIEEMRQLIDSGEESVRASLDKFNAIHDRWKAIGDVPRENMNDLWQSYHFQIEQFFNKLKINRELRSLDQKKNLEAKIGLCEQAEELTMEENTGKAFKALQDLRARWKEIGPVPAVQNEEIWQRFQAAARAIDERRREYYNQRKEEMDNNLLAKQALIDRATELTSAEPKTTKEWNDTTAALDELFKMWKTIGPVPREVNEEVWARFKGMIDKHYADKKQYFGSIRKEQNDNLQRKIDLCLKAEAIAKREDWKKAQEEILELQREWKEVGAVSRKMSDKVWHRFRAACDEFFAKKSAFFADRRESEGENLIAKEQLLAELKAHQFGDNREENMAFVKDIQRRWAEVGFVPMADKERLQKDFRAELDRIFEQHRISSREAEVSNYRERIRQAGSDAKHFVSNERQGIQDHIEKLRADLATWENNLGFFAASKQADLLKQEFEKKMQDTRKQIALLQAKLHNLSEAEKEKENPEQ